ncbi:MAG: TRAP transporter small permease [Spirochaetes bacterium]|nr:TRAP transporter small permease [Spirochaetota bacterium]
MKKIESILKSIVTITSILAGISLIALMVVTAADVILRAFFSIAVVGSNEISVAIMICAGFLGLAWCAFNDNHIKVDLVVCRFPVKIQKYFYQFNYLIVLIISLFISYASFNGAMDVKFLGSRSQLLEIPQYPFYLVTSFAYLLMALTALFFLIKFIVVKDIDVTCAFMPLPHADDNKQ